VAAVVAVAAVAVADAAVAVLPEEKPTADWQELAGRMGPKELPQLELSLPLQGLVAVERRSQGGQAQVQGQASELPQGLPALGAQREQRAGHVAQQGQQQEQRLVVRFEPQLQALRHSAARNACAHT